MTDDLIVRMYDEHVFDAMLLDVDMADYHVPFDALRSETATESTLRDSVSRFERVALSGASGSGKTSVARYALDAAPEGMAPIWVSLAYKGDGLASDPFRFAQNLVDVLSAHAMEAQRLSPEAREELLARVTAERALPGVARKRGASLNLKAWILQAGVAADVTRTVRGGAVPRAEGEVLERANEVLEAVRAHDLQPVLVMDDTDRLIGRGEPDRLIPLFFGSVLRSVVEDLKAGLVIAVQPFYLGRDDYKQYASGVVERHIPIPEVPDAAGVGELLTARVRYAAATATAADAFESAALDELFAIYRRQPARTVRALLAAAHAALSRARKADAAKVSVEHVLAGADDALLA